MLCADSLVDVTLLFALIAFQHVSKPNYGSEPHVAIYKKMNPMNVVLALSFSGSRISLHQPSKANDNTTSG
jgi:hypothetical protein